MDRQAPLIPTEFASAVTAITSAFGDPTRRDIYLFAHEPSDGVTAAEVAERFDLHPNVARHHLDKLAAGGYLEVAVDRAGDAGAGRPSKRYRASRASRSTLELPVRHDDLLITLLGRALALVPRDQAEAMAEEVGVEYGRVMAAAMGGTRRRPALVPRRPCTRWPTPSPPTVSPPTPRSGTTSCASSPSTARSATRPSSTR